MRSITPGEVVAGDGDQSMVDLKCHRREPAIDEQARVSRQAPAQGAARARYGADPSPGVGVSRQIRSGRQDREQPIQRTRRVRAGRDPLGELITRNVVRHQLA